MGWMYLSRLCLYKYDEVGDGGGDHGCQGAPLHREEVVAGEGAGVPHPGYGVLCRHHLSTVTTVNNPAVTVQQLIHSWACDNFSASRQRQRYNMLELQWQKKYLKIVKESVVEVGKTNIATMQ